MATKRRRKTTIEDRIIDVSEASPFLRALVYGRHGTRKTRFAASAPDVLILDINEEGTKSAKSFKGAKVFPAATYDDVVEAYWYLREGAGRRKYKSVSVDGATALQHLCMRYVLREAEDNDPYREPNMPDRRAWGKMSEILKPLILDFRNLPMNVIFTAHERTITDDDGVIEGYVPDLSPGVRGTLMGAVDVIGRMYVKEVTVVDKEKKKTTNRWESRMLVGPHDAYETKDRTGALGRIVREPNVPLILERMNAMDEEEE